MDVRRSIVVSFSKATKAIALVATAKIARATNIADDTEAKIAVDDAQARFKESMYPFMQRFWQHVCNESFAWFVDFLDIVSIGSKREKGRQRWCCVARVRQGCALEKQKYFLSHTDQATDHHVLLNLVFSRRERLGSLISPLHKASKNIIVIVCVGHRLRGEIDLSLGPPVARSACGNLAERRVPVASSVRG